MDKSSALRELVGLLPDHLQEYILARMWPRQQLSLSRSWRDRARSLGRSVLLGEPEGVAAHDVPAALGRILSSRPGLTSVSYRCGACVVPLWMHGKLGSRVLDAIVSARPDLSDVRIMGAECDSLSALDKCSSLKTLVVSLYSQPVLTDNDALRPLSRCVDLEHLEVHGCANTVDASPLASCTKLKHVMLWWCVVDLSVFASCDLHHLDVYGDLLSSLEPLRGMANLRFLRASGHTWLDDIGPLSSCTSLQHVVLNHTAVSDLSPLAACSGLHTLELSHTPVRDLSPLAACPCLCLRKLDLSHTPVRDLSPLAACPCLRELDLSDTDLPDLSSLADVTGLRVLDLSSWAGEAGSASPLDLSQLAGRSLRSLDISCRAVASLAPLASCPDLAELFVFQSTYPTGHLERVRKACRKASVHPPEDHWVSYDDAESCLELPAAVASAALRRRAARRDREGQGRVRGQGRKRKHLKFACAIDVVLV